MEEKHYIKRNNKIKISPKQNMEFQKKKRLPSTKQKY